jgi:starch-binding outer membrane protein, SusD/RagB family
MKKLIRILSILAIIFAFAATPACVDLDEVIFAEVLSDNFYKTQEEIISAMAPAYGNLRLIAHRHMWHIAGYSTDEILYPTRGRHWYDGGHFQRFHEHTWTPETPHLNNTWNYSFRWVNQANMLILQLQQLTNIDPLLRDAFTAELKIIRALGYWYLIDNFGNVPIVDRFDVEPGYSPPNNANFQAGRQQVFDFIEKDIIDNINNLAVNKDRSTYGRFHKWAAHALAVKLYMNAEVWTGTQRWDDAIAHADAIIDSELFQLEPNYFTNFLSENSGSGENIFVVPFNETQTGGGMSDMAFVNFHHYQMGRVFGTPRGGNNGICAMPGHYRSFHEDDIRRKGWMVGLQRNASTGAVLLCTEESAPNPLEYTVDFVNIYDPSDEAVYDHRNALEYHGARFVKYQIAYTSGNMGNDLAVYRYADILLLKAEALMRKNGGAATQQAVDLVNEVRSRAFENPGPYLYTTSSLTLDELLAERSRELYNEGMRRNDLIRFGKFVRGTWEFADRSGEQDFRNVYPIPQNQINVNPNLNQNPGY